MKVICIVVLYKPSTELLEKAIKSIVNQVDLVWISDNTPGGFKGMDTIAGVFKSQVEICTDGWKCGDCQGSECRYTICPGQ